MNYVAPIAPAVVPTMPGLARWSTTAGVADQTGFEAEIHAWFDSEKIKGGLTGYFCHADAGDIKSCRPISHRFGKFHERVVLRQVKSVAPRGEAPKWKIATIYFPDAYADGSSAPYNVSIASVLRSMRRADQAAARPPAEAKPPLWAEPATKPLEFIKQFDIFMDDEIVDKISVASRCRVYTVEEGAIAERWTAVFSDIRSGALNDSLDPERRSDLWPYFTIPVGANKSGRDLVIRPLTLHEVEFGFAKTTTLVNILASNKHLKKVIGAKTASGRVYQAACFLLNASKHRLVNPSYLIADRIVFQKVSLELRLRDLDLYLQRLAQLANRFQRLPKFHSLLDIVPFMLRPDVSSTDAAVRFGLKDASNLRDRLNGALGQIEKKFGKYCNALPDPPQNVKGTWYNIRVIRSPLSCRLKTPRLRNIPQPYSDESKPELEAMQQLARGLSAQQLPPGFALHYTGFASHCAGTAEIGRQYPAQPYGAEPLVIFLPQPAHDFGFDTSTELPPPLGLPFADNFQRWSMSWMNRGIIFSVVEPSPNTDSDDDLVDKLRAHGERGDERVTRVRGSLKFEDEIEDLDDPPFAPRSQLIKSLSG